MAVRYGHTATAEVLAKAGANLDLQNQVSDARSSIQAREIHPLVLPSPGGAGGAACGANVMKTGRFVPELWSGRGPSGVEKGNRRAKKRAPPESPSRLAPTGRGADSSGSGSAPGVVCRFSGRVLTVSCVPPPSHGAAPLLGRDHRTVTRLSSGQPTRATPRLSRR